MNALQTEADQASSLLTAELERAEHMDPGHVATTIGEAWRSLPPDLKQEVQQRAALLWQLRGIPIQRFLAFVAAFYGRNPGGWYQAFQQNRSNAAYQLALQAGNAAGLKPRPRTSTTGDTAADARVRDFHRRQLARGRVPGRNPQFRSRQREFEANLEFAAHALEFESAEGFFTRVTPIPGVGNKEGHEIITRAALRGLPLSSAEQTAVLDGVIRPDRGGRSYWNFPAAAIGSLRAAAQPSHALRPTPGTSTPAALALIRKRFTDLYRNALRAPNRLNALGWVGEALHLLQDSFSSAHVERAGPAGPIRKIRAFYIRAGWPPLSRAPHEHNAPSDPRDDVFLGGALRPEALAATRASRELLTMALRHLASPGSPSIAPDWAAFLRRHLS